MDWTIEAKMLPLAYLGGHLYLEIFDDEGKRVAQMNGLSVSRQTNKIIPIGKPGDKIKAFVCDKVILSVTSAYDRDNHPHEGHVICSGSKDEIEKIINDTRELAKEFNQNDFLYNVFQFNSNTVFSAMVHEIAKTLPVDHDALNKAISLRKLTPGVKSELMQHKQTLTEVFNTGWRSKQHVKKKPKSGPSR